MSERLERLVDRALPFLLLLLVVVLSIHKIVENDIWWQLAAGDWITTHGIPRTDPFSYFAPDRPWIEMRWLYCVAIHLIETRLGLNALILARVAMLVATFAALWWTFAKRSFLAASFGVACAVALAHPRFQIRPELVSFLFLTIELACLSRFRDSRDPRWLYALPVVQLVWTNAHTLFVLGPIVLWIFVAFEWLAGKVSFGPFRNDPRRLPAKHLRTAVIVAALASATCLLNPWFIEGALFPAQLFREIHSGNQINELIDELHSPFELAGFTFQFVSYLLVALLSAATFWLNRRRASLSTLATWAAFLYLSTTAQRNVGLFGLVAGFAIAENLGEFFAEESQRSRVTLAIPWPARVATLVFAIVMIPAVATDVYSRRANSTSEFGFGIADYRFPIRAMAFVRAHGLPVPVLNSLGDGGYILFEGGPKSVYIDGRLEVYGAQIISDALDLLNTGDGFDQLCDQYGIQTVVARHVRQALLVDKLVHTPNWIPVYVDPTYVVFVRDTAATHTVASGLRIDWQHPAITECPAPPGLEPTDWLAGLWPKVQQARNQVSLGQLFVATGNIPEAQRSFESALARYPDELTAAMYLGFIYQATGRTDEAAALLALAGIQSTDRADSQMLAGSIAELSKSPDVAIAAYQRAVLLGAPALQANLGIARAALAASTPQVARGALLEAARLKPGDPAIWNNLAVLAERAGSATEAIQYYESSLRANPGQPTANVRIGTLKAKSGDAAGAREAFERALAIDPMSQPARDGLASLASP